MSLFLLFSGWTLYLTIIALILIFGIFEKALRPAYHYKNDGGGIMLTLVFVFYLIWIFVFNLDLLKHILSFIQSKPLTFLLFIITYSVLGVLWSLIKWVLYLKDIKEFLGGTWERFGRPLAKNNSNKIITWMAYWPFSIVWDLIDRPFIRGFKWIQKNTAGLYDKIAKTLLGE
jgi:hypothetical protein